MALHRDKVGDAEDDSNTIYKDLKLNQWSRRIDLCVSFQIFAEPVFLIYLYTMFWGINLDLHRRA